mmetsp:Transcript_111559/g.315875  ORF Transcript_111559/g.315875 Transcript_111559/m.315875 type:complete len:233 (-) Transcript_111559:482-1180(-)
MREPRRRAAVHRPRPQPGRGGLPRARDDQHRPRGAGGVLRAGGRRHLLRLQQFVRRGVRVEEKDAVRPDGQDLRVLAGPRLRHDALLHRRVPVRHADECSADGRNPQHVGVRARVQGGVPHPYPLEPGRAGHAGRPVGVMPRDRLPGHGSAAAGAAIQGPPPRVRRHVERGPREVPGGGGPARVHGLGLCCRGVLGALGLPGGPQPQRVGAPRRHPGRLGAAERAHGEGAAR